MFDTEWAAASDEEVIAAIEEGARAEAAASARRLAAIAELVHRRVHDDDARAQWAFDPWDGATAEVAAALRVGHRRASGQMCIAVALRERLPRVAALHRAGALSARVISAITWSTHLVCDAQALALIDSALADHATSWEALAEDKLRQAVDVWVARYDPDAVRRTKTRTQGRDFVIGSCDDDTDTTAIWGRLLPSDAAVMKKRVTAMVRGVCDADPRSMGERRSDALGAIGAGNATLACRFGSPTCPAAAEQPQSAVVIHVITDEATLDAAHESQHAAQESEEQPAARGSDPTPRPKPATAALLMGHGVLPTQLLAEAIANGAAITAIRAPGSEPEPRYRPSAALAEFVRMRDLFCRFPGCDVSAELCDIDHARPWPWGPTHASNLNCKCRKHHLMKTFWTGIGGWTDEQLPDGTVIWTSPSGRRYTTTPGSRLFFPTWNTATAALPPPTGPPPAAGDRGLMMPRRRRTRAAERAARIKAERAQHHPPPF